MRILYVVVGLCVVLGIAAWALVFKSIASTNIGFPMRSYSIASTSMEPTIHVGELVMATAGYYRDHQPEIGDVAIHERPDGVAFIQRVVAGPGDRVRMEKGRLLINDIMAERATLSEFVGEDGGRTVLRYRETLPNGRAYEIIEMQGDLGQFDDMAEVALGEGQYFVLGDNRDNSYDSRSPAFGPVALEKIIDRPSIVWFSSDLARIGKDLQPAR